ncbi:MAG: aspartate ammonia-lyase [Dehalococcoidia bacterium]|nr:aspartate ammonia-lyase [Dehalococcoidia bacterium]
MARMEHDSLGEVEVPDGALYGAQTARAVANFPITGRRPHPYLIRATALIKAAAARANSALGQLDPDIATVIEAAALDVATGERDEHFVVDAINAGAGTSYNMNANEVIANLATIRLGGTAGDYSRVHPNDHVNRAQSTNDTVPAAIRLAALLLLAERFDPALGALHGALDRKAAEFDTILKTGRTHLQDAVPIRLGQEFAGYRDSVAKNRARVAVAALPLHQSNLGGTAAGTGLNAHPRYAESVCSELQRRVGFEVAPAANLVEAMQSMTDFAHLSGALRNYALDLSRIANDLRLLSSGPRTGLAEITLPPVQPGSSIMPGKVNPVVAENVNMVCFKAIGNDATVAWAAGAGQLELNVMMPVIADALLESIEILAAASQNLAVRAVDGITANEEMCRYWFERSVGLATVLNPYIGYDAAAKVAQRAAHEGRSLPEIILEEGILDPAQLEKVLDPDALTNPSIE